MHLHVLVLKLYPWLWRISLVWLSSVVALCFRLVVDIEVDVATLVISGAFLLVKCQICFVVFARLESDHSLLHTICIHINSILSANTHGATCLFIRKVLICRRPIVKQYGPFELLIVQGCHRVRGGHRIVLVRLLLDLLIDLTVGVLLTDLSSNFLVRYGVFRFLGPLGELFS